MSLPIVIANSTEQWDCHQCGYCCKGSLIPLSREDWQRIDQQGWSGKDEYRSIRIFVPDRSAPADIDWLTVQMVHACSSRMACVGFMLSMGSKQSRLYANFSIATRTA